MGLRWVLSLLLLSVVAVGCGNGAAADTGAIVGTWVWFNTPTIYIDANGDLRAPGTASIGHWVSADAANRLYQLSWDNGFVDRLTLSENADYLDGYNQYNGHVTAQRAQ